MQQVDKGIARPLRVLIVEDSPDDAELMLLELRRGGFDPSWQRVETSEEMRVALARGPWEVVLWDYTLPGFDAMSVLTLLQQSAEDLPFIVVTGTVGEEQAARLMKAGADDFLLKGSLSRLAPVVERTLRVAEERRARKQAQIEQDRLLGQLRLQIERLPLAYILFDAEHRVLDWNPAAESMFGYTKGEMVGRVANDLYLPRSMSDHVRDVIRRVMRGDMDAHGVSENRTKDGRIITYEWFNTPLMDPVGRYAGVFSLAQDITERVQIEEKLRESEERFRVALSAAPGIAVFGQDRDLRYTWAFNAQLGDTVKDGLGKTDAEILNQEDAARVTAIKRRVLHSGVRAHAEVTVTREETRAYDLTVEPLRDPTGQVAGITCVAVDITERKRAEEELRRAKAAAEAASRAKDEFLANVSHEIRTPFGAILGMTELVLETPLTDDQRQCLGTVKSAAESLLGLVDDLLDFEKIEAGKLELVPADFALRAMMADALRALGVRAEKKGLELAWNVEPDVPDALIGDAGRLQQVLFNLIGNAIKFTRHGEVAARVGVAGGPATDEEAVLCFTVRDTGIGIPADGRERIFRAFEQADGSTTREYGGTGLGLAIAARLVSLMGGTIAVESEPGRGSTFAFTARFGRPPHPPEEGAVARPLDSVHEAAPATGGASLRILVAEDDEFNARHLERLLGRRGHAVRVATGGREALELAVEAAFDLLLLDVHMPQLDGFQVVRAIRERERATGGHLPVIALTARARPEDRERRLAAGMDDYLAKPVRAAGLFATIERIVSAFGGPGPES